MGKVLVVTSGKGGVGKTTSTAALGVALARAGENVVVVDFDVGLRNLDLVMGAERRVVFDLINVVQGDAKLAQALIRDKRIANLSLLPASQTRDKDALSTEGVDRVIADLRERFDWVICDSPAGIERGALLAMRNADLAVVVTNPEVSSVRDSDRIIGILDAKTLRAENGQRVDKHLLVTRYDAGRAARNEMLKLQDRPRRARRAHREAPAADPLRPDARAARRDVEGRGRAGDPVDPAAGDHSGERRGPQGLQHRFAGNAEQSGECTGAGLFRRGQAAEGRNGRGGDPDAAYRHHRTPVRAEGGMSLFELFRKKSSAPVARDRLQVLLAHERSVIGKSDLLATLQEEILAVIAKHITVDRDAVQIKLDRGQSFSTLEIEVEVPLNVTKISRPSGEREVRASA